MELIPEWVKYQELWLKYGPQQRQQYSFEDIFNNIINSLKWLEKIMLDEINYY